MNIKFLLVIQRKGNHPVMIFSFGGQMKRAVHFDNNIRWGVTLPSGFGCKYNRLGGVFNIPLGAPAVHPLGYRRDFHFTETTIVFERESAPDGPRGHLFACHIVLHIIRPIQRILKSE